MTVDEAMAKASAAIDEAIANAMNQGIRTITGKGATEEEVESFVEWYGQQLADDRAANLRTLRSWLEREGGTLQ